MNDRQMFDENPTITPEQAEQIAKIVQGRSLQPQQFYSAPLGQWEPLPDQVAAEARQHVNQQVQQNMSLSQSRMTMEEKVEWCKLMSAGDMAPRQYQGSPSNVLFALEYAEAVGVPAIHALMSIAVINGKPSPSAELMVTLTRKAGHKVWTEVADDGLSATTYVERADMPGKVFSDTFDKAKAQTAGLWGKTGPWQNYPDVMLANRSKSRCIRMACPEVLAGVTMSAEEQADMVDGEVVDETEKKQAKPKGLAAAKKRTRKAPAKKKPEPALEQEQGEESVDPANLSEGAVAMLTDARKGDADTRRELWKAAGNLDEAECLYVRAEIEAMNQEDNNANA